MSSHLELSIHHSAVNLGRVTSTSWYFIYELSHHKHRSRHRKRYLIAEYDIYFKPCATSQQLTQLGVQGGSRRLRSIFTVPWCIYFLQQLGGGQQGWGGGQGGGAGAPGGPGGPGGPAGPCPPGHPGQPFSPGQPGAPMGPLHPGIPAGAWGPGAPMGPAGPTGPAGPGQPLGPGHPGVPAGPKQPAAPAGPGCPTGPGAPGAAGGGAGGQQGQQSAWRLYSGEWETFRGLGGSSDQLYGRRRTIAAGFWLGSVAALGSLFSV